MRGHIPEDAQPQLGSCQAFQQPVLGEIRDVPDPAQSHASPYRLHRRAARRIGFEVSDALGATLWTRYPRRHANDGLHSWRTVVVSADFPNGASESMRSAVSENALSPGIANRTG